MRLIDAQVHAYERNHKERPWVDELVGPKEVTGDTMVGEMESVGVDGAILVSPGLCIDMTPATQRVFMRNIPISLGW